ncbi:ferric iron reductase [Streptomyces adustus]|uniref:Ferric iron reductase n=1 Tax=Streptomyces adustus TaxID=1609272 RepID=A0A5N8VM23_9ACTN|nr:IucA/IucC family C-terminal-domain containing protein [Streptomyces adustus]MPY36317.1 ferric iron reductase [Streptomyces adustus]
MVLLLVVDHDLDPGLAALRPLGGFFVLRTLPAAPAAPAGPPPALKDVYDNPAPDGHPDPLDFRIRKVTRSLRTAEARVGASVAHQALAARLWSAALGCAALYGRIPDLDPRLLRWDADAGAPDDLWLSEVRPLPADPATVADAVLTGHLRPLTALVRTRYRVAEGLLWGNAGSALAGAARELDRWARANGRTDVAAGARSLAAALLRHPLLTDTGTLTGTAFRRRNCCLYYRVPGGGVCGDCCFVRPPRSSARDTSG